MYLSPVYTAAPAVADERVGAVFAALDSLGIPYIRFEHDATATMEDCAAVGKALEGTICKNLFLCNRQQTAFYLLTMPGDKPFHTKDLSGNWLPPMLWEENLNCVVNWMPPRCASSVWIMSIISGVPARVRN